MKRTVYVSAWKSGELYVADAVSKFSIPNDGTRWLENHPVEIEIPDPPHEWKVGDWFTCEGWMHPARIADMGDRYFAFHYRDSVGDPTADMAPVGELADATPCDPPDWFTEGGASRGRVGGEAA